MTPFPQDDDQREQLEEMTQEMTMEMYLDGGLDAEKFDGMKEELKAIVTTQINKFLAELARDDAH